MLGALLIYFGKTHLLAPQFVLPKSHDGFLTALIIYEIISGIFKYYVFYAVKTLEIAKGS